MKILVDEGTGKRYEAIPTFQGSLSPGDMYWVKEIKEQKTFSWNDVANGVLCSWADGCSSRLLDDGFREAADANSCNNLRFSSEWNVWRAGGCPLPEGVMVEVEYRCRSICEGEAVKEAWGWEFPTVPSDHDIIAYRVTGLAEGYVYPDELNK